MEFVGARPVFADIDRHTFQLDPAGVEQVLTRDEFRDEMRMRNIGTGLHFLTVHQLSFYRERYCPAPGFLENSEYVASRIVSLPLFPDMVEEDVVEVVQTIREILSERRR